MWSRNQNAIFTFLLSSIRHLYYYYASRSTHRPVATKGTMAIIFVMWTLSLLLSSIIQVTNASQFIPLLQYDLTMDDCHKATFFNEGILGKDSIGLIRNASTTACALGMGVESNFHLDLENTNETTTSKTLYASKPMDRSWKH